MQPRRFQSEGRARTTSHGGPPPPDEDSPYAARLIRGLRGEVVSVVFFLLLLLAATVGPRNELSDAWALFMPEVGEGFEWELALCCVLLCFFFALPFMHFGDRYMASSVRMKAYAYAVIGVLVVLFVMFDTSVGLIDLIVMGNYTQARLARRT